jgi:Zn-dependent metalloprotease
MRHVSQSAVAAALLAGRVLGHPHPATSENNTFSAPTYVDTASQLVKKVASGTEFRVVTSYKSDTGVGHVVFKQQVHGIDIDTADFNVNVSFTRKFNRPKANGSRLAKMARSFHTEILSSLELFQQRVH